jgi:DnaJ-class molecular chaperone
MILMAYMAACAQREPCSKCGGSGVQEDRNNERCKHCEGSGKEPLPPMNEG